ncbi:hypothetical protein K8374_15400 [Pseudomonas sp. p1(2021b)]|uniref:dermonecrotic toxin domain-containing protein n=1 Tax=Pseudomonas sp. p1(2021b) TaxID=2874628 RepID=UPI001CCBDDA8|nr:DUF6543 domain-containing protein [Pseudomonas sp. p1(2021b)]UBM23773.1 hypothetical protein K8374_15400 [Pseudomonas sp. p1(2021b)]
MNALSRRPRNTGLQCQVANRFAARPTLLDVAADILTQYWQAHGLPAQIDPLTLYLVRQGPAGTQPDVSPLYEVLIERLHRRRTLNLTPQEAYLSSTSDVDPATPVEIDLHRIELLINACGPWVMDQYRRALIDFWNETDTTGQSPWQWLSDYLRQQFERLVTEHRQQGTLPASALSVAQWLQDHQASAPGTEPGMEVHNLRVDLLTNWQLDPDLASALLIERTGQQEQAHVALLYTPTGRLIPYRSRQHLLAMIGRRWPQPLAAVQPHAHLEPLALPPFDAQALGLLLQQLQGVYPTLSLLAEFDSPLKAVIVMQRMTSMQGLCNVDETTLHESLAKRLPDWLRDADPESLSRYSLLLMDVARTYEAQGAAHWLEGVQDASAFAYDSLQRLIQRDHPQAKVDLAAIHVVNRQVTAVAIPVQDSLVSTGDIQPQRFTLAQLAVANLGLLRPGKVELESTRGHSVPDWLNESYLRQLITEADVGKRYPAMLRATLLDDPAQLQRRARLLCGQLHSQLPALAMELHMRGKGISEDAVRSVGQAFAGIPDDPRGCIVRAFGLLRTLDATPDYPTNVWLLEARQPHGRTCLLYRPLHATPLLEFADRHALLDAVATPGPLQDDLLQRLPEQDRKVYAHGGFQEPHLFHPLEDDWAVPFGSPAPVTLSLEPPLDNPAQAVYRGCIEEVISDFQQHAYSTEQARWERWKQVGWLLLNTVLPFAPKPVAAAGWVFQMETDLLSVLAPEKGQPRTDRIAALIDLLFNIASLLCVHAWSKIERLRPVTPRLDAAQVQAPGESASIPSVVLAEAEPLLEPAWANASRTLAPAQREALANLRARLHPSQLGTAIPNGPWRGLYLHDDKSWAVVDGHVYQVAYDTQQQRPRIVDRDQSKPAGPWLFRDEAGRWQLDLRLRLRGGMPLSSRLAEMKQANQQALAALDKAIADDVVYSNQQQAYLDKASQVANNSTAEPILRNYLEKAQAFSTFWEQHLKRLAERNERQPLRNYKISRAHALGRRIRCEHSILATLRRLHDPQRLQIQEMIKRQHEGYTLTESDQQAITRRVDSLLPLLDALIAHSQTVTDALDQLKRLASRSQPKINEYLAQAQQGYETPSSPLAWRFNRLEACTNRLILLEQLDDEGGYWLERYWTNLELAVVQRLKFSDLETIDDEVAVRLLASMEQQVSSALRQLDNLRHHLGPAGDLQVFPLIKQDLDVLANDIRQQAEERPAFTPNSTINQLRAQLPGLIETQDQGVLLGQVRADDESIVDVQAPDQISATRSYKLENQRWVLVQPPSPPPRAAAPGKLKHLLKAARARMASARAAMRGFGEHSLTRYLPVEIEELLQHQSQTLGGLREDIERRLTADNSTDETSGSDDAAQVVKALEDLSAEVTAHARSLRIAAALRQKPRMQELRLLIDQSVVEVRPQQPRTAMAKVKGRPDNYLDEYGIYHEQKLIWVAHFHYRSMVASKEAFTAGHLKLASQRYAKGQTSVDPDTGQTVSVYRSPIPFTDAQHYFFTV